MSLYALHPSILAIMLAMLLSFAIIRVTSEQKIEPEYALASAEEVPVICVDIETKAKIQAIILEGLDNALRAHIERLFTVWMKTVSDPDQPSRIRTGMQHGLVAWQQTNKAVQEWRPMMCQAN